VPTWWPSACPGSARRRLQASLAKPRWPEAHAPDAELWQVFQPAPDQVTEAGPLAGRFRLAGTFFVSGGEGDGATGQRKAILDDLRTKQQVLLAEGESWDGVQAVSVLDDQVRLRQGGAEETIRLSFLGGTAAVAAAGTNQVAGGGVAVDQEPTLETTRFGRKVGLNRWVLQREELTRYYQSLLDDPERIAALYVSLKPDYKESAITGYTLDVTGEADFFAAMGMQQGDVIRKVNSMNMTSQKRAEYFMGEFMKNRLNAFVLDIERGGKPEKLIYLVR
jgi:type II secretory pathway component PulC